MNKIIKRRRYDTGTATRRAFYANNGAEETLYQKMTGEYFLHESGKTETITPLTYAGAQEWAKKRLPAAQYEALFGEVKTKQGAGGSVQINFRVSPICAATIRRRAAEAGLPIGDWLEQEVMR
jgi:hypothetical protein